MKNIIVSGAGGNLGDAVVDTFIKSGYRVLATVHSADAKNIPGSGMNPETHVVEASDADAVRKFIGSVAERHGAVDGVILLVGGFAAGNLEKTTVEDLRKMMTLNFETAYNYVQPALACMKQQDGGGKIIFVGSRPGKNPGAARTSIAYALSKSLLFRLAEIVNAEGKQKNISATVVVPGTIDTKANRLAMPGADFSKWNNPYDIALRMEKIISGEEKEPVVEFE